MNRLITLIAIMTFGISCAFSQTISGEKLNSKLAASKTILNDYQNLMADKSKSDDVKRQYLELALDLFVNKGEPFTVDSISYEGATITTTSAYRNKEIKRKMRDYLQGIIDLRYTPIDLTVANIPPLPSQIDTKELKKLGDNQYAYTFLVTRELAGYIDGTPVYKDITPYKYTLFLFTENTINGLEYIVYLSDVVIDGKEEEKK